MTKHVRFISICILTLLVAFEVVSACSCAAIQSSEQASSNIDKKTQSSTNGHPRDFEVSGDPVDNPKPNSDTHLWRPVKKDKNK